MGRCTSSKMVLVMERATFNCEARVMGETEKPFSPSDTPAREAYCPL